jgi:hypothetical protein
MRMSPLCKWAMISNLPPSARQACLIDDRCEHLLAAYGNEESQNLGFVLRRRIGSTIHEEAFYGDHAGGANL